MQQFNYDLNEIKDSLIYIIRYIVGKRASDADYYYRHTACRSDSAILSELCFDSVLWLAANLRARWDGYAIKGDVLTISLEFLENIETSSDKYSETELLLRQAIIYRMLYLWLRLTGHPEASKWEQESLSASQEVDRIIRINGPLKQRPFPPL